MCGSSLFTRDSTSFEEDANQCVFSLSLFAYLLFIYSLNADAGHFWLG